MCEPSLDRSRQPKAGPSSGVVNVLSDSTRPLTVIQRRAAETPPGVATGHIYEPVLQVATCALSDKGRLAQAVLRQSYGLRGAHLIPLPTGPWLCLNASEPIRSRQGDRYPGRLRQPPRHGVSCGTPPLLLICLVRGVSEYMPRFVTPSSPPLKSDAPSRPEDLGTIGKSIAGRGYALNWAPLLHTATCRRNEPGIGHYNCNH